MRSSAAPDAKIQEVLDKLDWWDGRNQGHHTQKRTSFRPSCRTLILVRSANDSECDAVAFKAWTRNISQGGLAFILPRQYSLDKVRITWCHDKADPPSQLQARVVRTRRVHDGYYEYGVEFLSREGLSGAVVAAASTNAECGLNGPDAGPTDDAPAPIRSRLSGDS